MVVNSGANLVQYADVNGDGNLDIIGYDNGFFAVYLGQGGSAFAQTPLVQLISGEGGLVQRCRRTTPGTAGRTSSKSIRQPAKQAFSAKRWNVSRGFRAQPAA